MLATTKPVDKVETLDAMLDPNGKPVEGSALVILMQAHKKDSSSDDPVLHGTVQSQRRLQRPEHMGVLEG